MAYLSCAKDNEYPLLLIFNLITSFEDFIFDGLSNLIFEIFFNHHLNFY